jgi:hypothetical protein
LAKINVIKNTSEKLDRSSASAVSASSLCGLCEEAAFMNRKLPGDAEIAEDNHLHE